MTDASADLTGVRLSGHLGLAAEANANGSLRRFDCGSISLLLFVGNELEGGPTNLYLRRLGGSAECTPLLGPQSPTCFEPGAQNGRFAGTGSWLGVEYSLELVLSKRATAWFWHVQLSNGTSNAQVLDITYAHDLALAPYGAVRMNEFYVSQYLDHTPLTHPTQGVVVASRQNQAADGRHPWCIVGSLRIGASFATDALQFHGLANREGTITGRLAAELPNRRLQHEHSMVVIRDAPIRLEPRGSASGGFFGGYFADHPEATSHVDLEEVKRILDLREAKPALPPPKSRRKTEAATLFSPAVLLNAHDLTDDALRITFPAPWRHEERDDRGTLLSFFHGADRHVVLRAKELRVQRPHGHLLRTGRHPTPDETALTSTAWMGGVFHSMVTQGHVSINRFLSTVHSYVSLFRSHGQRVFVQLANGWQLLDTPSGFEMSPDACRWIYRHDAGEISVRAEARSEPQELALSVEFTAGAPTAVPDRASRSAQWRRRQRAGPARSGGKKALTSSLRPRRILRWASRFPNGSFHIAPAARHAIRSYRWRRVAFHRRAFASAAVSMRASPRRRASWSFASGDGCYAESRPAADLCGAAVNASFRDRPRRPRTRVHCRRRSHVSRTSCRGSRTTRSFITCRREVSSNTRAAAGARAMSARDRWSCCSPWVACSRFAICCCASCAQQNPDGDWPQWFMFFERERDIRRRRFARRHRVLAAAGARAVSHRFRRCAHPRRARAVFRCARRDAGAPATVWQHAERALCVDRAARHSGHGACRLRPRRLERRAAARRSRRCASICAAPGP